MAAGTDGTVFVCTTDCPLVVVSKYISGCSMGGVKTVDGGFGNVGTGDNGELAGQIIESPNNDDTDALDGTDANPSFERGFDVIGAV